MTVFEILRKKRTTLWAGWASNAKTGNSHPILTLARIKDPAVSLTPLRNLLEELDAAEFGRFSDRFHLYLSKPGPAGSIYTQLAEFPFTKE